MATIFKSLYKLDHIFNVVSSLTYDIWPLNIKSSSIFEESICIESSNIPNRLTCLFASLI